MGEVINFLQYRDMKESERERLRTHFILVNKSESITGVLNAFSNSVGISFIAKYLNEMNQIVGKEFVIDNDLYIIITEALESYRNSLFDKIKETEQY